jgi:hypothetical protein
VDYGAAFSRTQNGQHVLQFLDVCRVAEKKIVRERGARGEGGGTGRTLSKRNGTE